MAAGTNLLLTSTDSSQKDTASVATSLCQVLQIMCAMSSLKENTMAVGWNSEGLELTVSAAYSTYCGIA